MSHVRKVIILTLVVALFVPLASSAQTAGELKAKIQALLDQVKQLQTQLDSLIGGQNKQCHTFNTNLGVGDQGSEVSALREYLDQEGTLLGSADDEIRPPGTSIGFTKYVAAAVTGFQEKYRDDILTPAGLKSGTGYLGPKTRAKLNRLYGCGQAAKVIDWGSLLPSMRTVLKQAFPNERIEESRSISIYKKVDVTGDGVPEVLVNLGTGGATTDLVTSMRIENGEPIAPLFKQKDGKISTLIFTTGAGGSGRYGSTAEMLGNKNAIYSASYSKYGESADYCRVEAYQWNSQTKVFEYNAGLSNEVQQEYCRTAGTGF